MASRTGDTGLVRQIVLGLSVENLSLDLSFNLPDMAKKTPNLPTFFMAVTTDAKKAEDSHFLDTFITENRPGHIFWTQTFVFLKSPKIDERTYNMLRIKNCLCRINSRSSNRVTP
eukprot:scaffold8724_cov61-Cylindrotheca_fusiformis.AAC.1